MNRKLKEVLLRTSILGGIFNSCFSWSYGMDPEQEDPRTVKHSETRGYCNLDIDLYSGFEKKLRQRAAEKEKIVEKSPVAQLSAQSNASIVIQKLIFPVSETPPHAEPFVEMQSKETTVMTLPSIPVAKVPEDAPVEREKSPVLERTAVDIAALEAACAAEDEKIERERANILQKRAEEDAADLAEEKKAKQERIQFLERIAADRAVDEAAYAAEDVEIETKRAEERKRIALADEFYAQSEELIQSYVKALKDINQQNVEEDYDEDLNLCFTAACKNYVQAQILMGVLFLEGQKVTQNYKLAMHWFMRAANQNDTNAKILIGLLYYDGLGVERDDTKALKWFYKAANQKNIGITEDPKLSLEKKLAKIKKIIQMLRLDLEKESSRRLKDRADHGDIQAQCKLAWAYVDRDDQKQSFKYFKLAADQGNEEAQYQIGLRYGHTRGEDFITWVRHSNAQEQTAQYQYICYKNEQNGVERDVEEAYRYLQLAANQGNSSAQDHITRRIPEEKESFFQYAVKARKGDLEALYYLALKYEGGKGTSENQSEAFKYFKLAADQGHAEAQYHVGMRYAHLRGPRKLKRFTGWFGGLGDPSIRKNSQNGVERNVEEAYGYLQLSAEQGHSGAQFFLKKYDKIFTHVKLAVPQTPPASSVIEANEYEAFWEDFFNAKRRKPEAQYKVALRFKRGIGTQKNERKALKYFHRAADQGNEEAQYKLGLLYKDCYAKVQYKLGLRYEDWGDDLNAINYFYKAASHGYAKAQDKLEIYARILHKPGLLYKNEDGIEKNYDEVFKWFHNVYVKIQEDEFYNCNLTDEDGFQIAFLISKTAPLHKIYLSHNKLTSQWLPNILKALQSHPTLSKLDIEYNLIDDQGGKELLSFFEKNTHLKEISVVGNPMTPKIEKSIKRMNVLRTRIEDICSYNTFESAEWHEIFSSCDFTDDNAPHIATLFSHTKPLSKICLSNNKFTSLGLQKILDAFQYHPNLVELDISNNNIDNEGGKALLIFIEKCSSMKKILVDGNPRMSEEIKRAIKIRESLRIGPMIDWNSSQNARLELSSNISEETVEITLPPIPVRPRSPSLEEKLSVKPVERLLTEREKVQLFERRAQGEEIVQNYANNMKTLRANVKPSPISVYTNQDGLTEYCDRDLQVYLKSADQNYVEGQIVMGVLYFKGQEVAQDYKRAMYWFKRATEQNDEEAKILMGILYYDGLGVERNDTEALKWFYSSEDQNDGKITQTLEVPSEKKPIEKEEKLKLGEPANEDNKKITERMQALKESLKKQSSSPVHETSNPFADTVSQSPFVETPTLEGEDPKNKTEKGGAVAALKKQHEDLIKAQQASQPRPTGSQQTGDRPAQKPSSQKETFDSGPKETLTGALPQTKATVRWVRNGT